MDANKIGFLIKKTREEKNISLRTLAQDTCSFTYISKIENGERLPSLKILTDISLKLEKPIEYFIFDDNVLQLKQSIYKGLELYKRNDFSLLKKEMDSISNKISISSDTITLNNRFYYEIFIVISDIFINSNIEEGIKQLFKLQVKYEKKISVDLKFLFDINTFLLESISTRADYNQSYEFITKKYNKELLSKKFHYNRFYLHLITIKLIKNDLTNVLELINQTINNCKIDNNHYFLVYLYFLKSQYYFKINDIDLYLKWLSNAKNLNRLIAEDHRLFNDGYIRFYKYFSKAS